MNVIIVEEDKTYANWLESLLHESGSVKHIIVYENPREVLKEFINQSIDIVFLSIEWTKLKNHRLLMDIKKLHPEIKIVFVSNSKKLGVYAFNIEVFDYLLKPVQRERLEVTLERCISLNREQQWVHSHIYHPATLYMFGELEIRNDKDMPLNLNWRTRRVKETFAFLLYLNNQIVRKDILVEMIWPEYEYNDAISLLYTTIYQLRSMLKELNLDIVIINRDSGYKLELGKVRLDVEEWENNMLHFPELTKETVGKHGDLLWSCRGKYLESLPYPWADNKRDHLAILWFHHALLVCNMYISMSDYSAALEIGKEICRRYPNNHEGYRLMIRLYQGLRDFDSANEQQKLLNQLSSN